MIEMCRSIRRATVYASAALMWASLPASAQTPTPSAPAASASGQQSDPQQIRQELDRLRQEFEAIRDSYGERLAALEAKLGTTTATQPAPVPLLPEAAPAAAATPPAAAAQQAEAPAAAPAPAPQGGGVEVPSGAAGAGGRKVLYRFMATPLRVRRCSTPIWRCLAISSVRPVRTQWNQRRRWRCMKRK